MKRVLCFLLVLVVLSTSLVAVTGYSLIKESDNVTFTLVDEWGDRRYLEGVTAEMEFSHHDQLNWTVEFTPLEDTVTDYRYNTIIPRNDQVYGYYGFSGATFSLIDMKNDNRRLKTDIENLKSEIKNDGEIKTLPVKFKDYYEYYPVYFDFNLGELYVSWHTAMGYDDVGSYSFSEISYNRSTEFVEAMRSYFKIPVHEEDVREMRVHKHADGGYSYGASYYCSFDFLFYNAVFSDKLYFTFSNEMTDHNGSDRLLVDTSLIPGGYGIYSVPYTENDVKYEEIRTAYSISADSTVKALCSNEERNELYLALHENDKYVLHVIDTKTMTDISVIELFDFNSEEYVRVEQNEDFFVFIKNDGDFNVVAINEDRTYESALTGTMPPETIADRDYFSYRSRFGFDGERLAVWVFESPGMEEIKILSLQPDVMIFTKDGLQYYCKWLCSLGDPVAQAIRWEAVSVREWKITLQ